MSLAKSVYNLFFKRTSTFAVTIMVGAVLFERVFDQGGDAIFEQINRGVSASSGLLNLLTLYAEGEAALALAELTRLLNRAMRSFKNNFCMLWHQLYEKSNITSCGFYCRNCGNILSTTTKVKTKNRTLAGVVYGSKVVTFSLSILHGLHI